jgi:hypothetical protein
MGVENIGLPSESNEGLLMFVKVPKRDGSHFVDKSIVSPGNPDNSFSSHVNPLGGVLAKSTVRGSESAVL